MKYIVCEFRRDRKQMWYVAARPGYMRCKDGTMKRDGSFKGGPEWTAKRAEALEFTSYLSAARVKGKCPTAKVVTVNGSSL